ncbi:MAG: hypothetical protein IPP87_15025 [Ideonella sp.]|nr:hypothetical protein [Ideonella sp.]
MALAFFRGLSHAEVAEHLAQALGTVKSGLGLVQPGGETRLLRTQLLRDTAAFAVSLEPPGGSPPRRPGPSSLWANCKSGRSAADGAAGVSLSPHPIRCALRKALHDAESSASLRRQPCAVHRSKEQQ